MMLALSALACERSRSTPTTDTTTTAVRNAVPTTPMPRVPSSGWDASAGAVLVVRDSVPSSGFVVFPQYTDSVLPDTVRFESESLRGTALDLLGRAGQVGEARVGAITSQEWSGSGCIEWPTASLHAIGDTTLPPAWSVAFTAGLVQPIALDSLDALSRPDSARLAADITRLASALPHDTVPAFRGVPFAVDRAYRFSLASGTQVIVAEVVRRLNQEANPLEQEILLVAERANTTNAARPHTVYFERHSGSEDRLETFDVLAAVLLGAPRHPALVLMREGPETNAYALLERGSDGQWRLRWTSARTGC